MIKRLFDLMAAGTALVILSPVLAVIAFLIRWDSAGPVFFRQVRIGRSGKPFSILKFRTMVADAEKRGGEITFGGDRRITAFGAFLRRYKLDELPQLINILRGDMSLVGPRPEVPTYVALWPEDVRTEVLSMRPGLTDLASIIYADEAAVLASYPDPELAYRTIVTPEKLRLYVDYVRTHTFTGDLMLILRTFGILGSKAPK